jgi:hypothetical protein
VRGLELERLVRRVDAVDGAEEAQCRELVAGRRGERGDATVRRELEPVGRALDDGQSTSTSASAC